MQKNYWGDAYEYFKKTKPHSTIKRRSIVPSSPVFRLFEFSKIDSETGEGVAGAEFQMMDQYGKSHAAVSDTCGKVKFYIVPTVLYKMTEVKNPPGYLPDNTVYIIQISKFGDAVVNRRFASGFCVMGEMRKVFADFFFTYRCESKPVQGAVFKLIKDDLPILESVSSHSGLILFEKLTPGIYAMEETSLPSGCLAEQRIWQVIIARDGSITVDGISSRDFAINGKMHTNTNL